MIQRSDSPQVRVVIEENQPLGLVAGLPKAIANAFLLEKPVHEIEGVLAILNAVVTREVPVALQARGVDCPAVPVQTFVQDQLDDLECCLLLEDTALLSEPKRPQGGHDFDRAARPPPTHRVNPSPPHDPSKGAFVIAAAEADDDVTPEQLAKVRCFDTSFDSHSHDVGPVQLFDGVQRQHLELVGEVRARELIGDAMDIVVC